MPGSRESSGDRAAALIRMLRMKPHPEGGHYVETFRSPVSVRCGRRRRAAVTTIYFLLRRGEMSRLHGVRSDEIWNYCEGAPLRLIDVDPDAGSCVVRRLGPVDRATSPQAVIPAGHWQAAESTGRYTLVACTVAPGFEFADFAMTRDRPAAAALLLRRVPRLRRYL